MPLFEMEATPAGRVRVFLRAQLPFILGTIVILMVVFIARPDRLLTPTTLTAYVVIAAASASALALPWERIPRAWMVCIAVADIVAVALLRAELMTFVPAVTVLGLFPVLWLAYGFPWYGMAVGIVGSVFIIAYRFAHSGAWPASAAEWANIFAFPALIVGIAILVFIAARHLRRNAQRLAASSRAQDEALREAKDAEAIALGILNTVNAGVAFYDQEGRLDVANPLAHRMVEMVGFRLDEPPYAGDDVLAEDRVSRIPYDQQIIPRALRGEVIDNHVEWLGPADSQVAILASSGRVHREDGRLLGTVVVAYDVTELADAVEVREQFLRTVSHELRTPITSITGFLDLLADAADPDDEKLQRYIEIVSRKTDDLFHRVGDLLNATDTVKELTVAPVDVAAIVRQAVGDVSGAASAHGVRIDVTGPESIAAEGDGRQLLVGVTEVLTNAIKFGDPDSSIAVATRTTEDAIEIAVSNRGIGLGHSEQRRVFDRFYRTADARARQIQGFGLGLTNLRAIVLAHGGSVRVESAPGRGATFTICLPRRPKP